MKTSSRVLLLSLRNINLHVSRCATFEAENVIAECSDADILAPRRPAAKHHGFMKRAAKRILRLREPLIDGTIRVEKDYDMFFAICHSPYDLQYIKQVKDIDRCAKSVCVVDEFWPSPALSADHVKVLQGFDFVFSVFECGVKTIQQATGRPCHYSPWGIDALGFCPNSQPMRHINVYSMGRRVPEIHQAFLTMSEEDRLFNYVHDTVADFEVTDPGEHRRQVINNIKRSQYFITYPARFDQPSMTRGNVEMGARFFEGAAGGSVMIGIPPACQTFRECFNYPDAVIPIEGDIAEFITKLNKEPQRLNRIRKDNVINSLERHDWAYRWRDIVNSANCAPVWGIKQRIDELQKLANRVWADRTSFLTRISA